MKANLLLEEPQFIVPLPDGLGEKPFNMVELSIKVQESIRKLGDVPSDGEVAAALREIFGKEYSSAQVLDLRKQLELAMADFCFNRVKKNEE